ncbi:MAG: ABC transporter ATP-binding protein [Lachnospiraceae bacterium]|nr:ABC transporter ATP-binding protein [Lachnospiraceae bacterium]
MSLELKGIVKKYGKKTVLSGLDLTIEEGKIYGLVGRNGAGKTTMLSIASAQNPVTGGEVLLDGEKVWENQKALDQICFSREVGNMVNGVQNTMKVREYLRVAQMLFPHWDKEMAERLVDEFELDKKQRIFKLSKGMQSMVTIIIALASKAKYTFLDEPAAGLDVVARENFYRILLDEYSESGRTFVVSTHIIEEAAEVFEEVIFLDKGKILLKENTDDLLERCIHVSGKAEDVDAVSEGKKMYHPEKLGRSKGVTLLLEQGESFDKSGKDIDVSPVSLQDVFVALCGGEETV